MKKVKTKVQHYTCPMHPEVLSEKPGVCPRCHMALEKIKQSKNQKLHESHDKHTGHNPNVFRQKFWISLILTIPALLFSPTIQSWLGFSLEFSGSHYVPAFIGIIIFLYGGLVFLKSAKAEITALRPGMMTLISIAIVTAFFYSSLVTLRLVDGMDFWWELATLITIMLLGHWLEMASVERATGALNELAKLLPDEAELLKNGQSSMVLVSQLKVGDTILVRPGGKIPIDGVVIKGQSKVNESMLTGESKPIKKMPGSAVIGGTVTEDGALTIKVEKIGDDTALAGIMKMVEDAKASKSNTQILADKAAFYLTFIAITAAILTWIGWWIAGASTGFILERVVTVLIIACPHALGLAIPLVTAISTTVAAKNGILVRKRSALELARSIDVVMFDKTGTLTKGEQGVIDTVSKDVDYTLSLASAVEHESEHSIAKAIVKHAREKNITRITTTDFSALPGLGVKAYVSGKSVAVGGIQLLKQLKLKPSKEIIAATLKAEKEGKTAVYVINDNAVIGVIILADVIRSESKDAVTKLKNMSKRVALITGDGRGVAKSVAKELGIKEYFADVLPQHKAQVVKKLQTEGKTVAMVGDGVNDAPALTQADVGIAIGAGTDVAIESADIVLASSDPRSVSKMFTLSSRTYSKMVQNLLWATGYNVLAIPLATGITMGAGFVISPAIGAGLMSLSTVITAINAQLLRKVKL